MVISRNFLAKCTPLVHLEFKLNVRSLISETVHCSETVRCCKTTVLQVTRVTKAVAGVRSLVEQNSI